VIDRYTSDVGIDRERAVTDILESLGKDGLRALCKRRSLAIGPSDTDRRNRLRVDSGGELLQLIEDLRRVDLIAALQDRAFDVDCAEYGLGRLHQAKLEHLRRAAIAVFAEGWKPHGDGSGPPGAGPIDSYLLGSDDERDDFDDDDEHDAQGDEAHEHDVAAFTTLLDDIDEDDDAEGSTGFKSFDAIDPWQFSPENRPDAVLTDFQREAVQALDRHYAQSGARGLLCLPTGGGKTRTSLDWLLARFVARGLRVLWVTHRVDLLKQVHEEVRELSWLLRESRKAGFSVSRYQGQRDAPVGDIILASAQLLARRKPSRAQFSQGSQLGIVVYDEAHRAVARGTWRALSRILGEREVPFLGLTATPFRTEAGGTARIEAELGKAIYQRTFKDLIDLGFLAKPVFLKQQLRSTEAFQLRPAELADIRGRQDLTSSVLGRLARHPGRNEEIVEHWISGRTTYGKTLAFACDIPHAERMAKMMADRGVRANALHSGLSDDERLRRLRHFKRGALEVLVNVGILTEGANVPDTQTVLMARPTMSTSLYMQMIGRGARGPKTVPGKTQFYVIDCVVNFAQHGLPLAGREVASRLAEPGLAIPLVTRRTRRAAEEERRERREVTSAAAWLAARGYDPSAYSFWGELRWESENGPASVAVFTETLAPVEEAVRLARDAVTTGHWHLARDRGPHLESVGAMRAADWSRAIKDAQRTHSPLQLLPVPELALDANDLEAASGLRQLADELRTRGFDAAMQSVDRAWASIEPLRARFASAVELRQEVMTLASALVAKNDPPAIAVAPDNTEPALEAFVEVALSMARADGVVQNAERLAILRGTERLFQQRQPELGLRAQHALAAREDGQKLDAEGALTKLRAVLDWPERLVTFDLLFRVALADGALAQDERVLLERCAVGLEIPPDELADRLRWYESVHQAPVAPPPHGFRTCAACSSTFAGNPNFCGQCGTALSLSAPTA
jgi:superfamily II DNA or RNA helicase/uncharacterized tellurite resistance protein B-like protein